MVAFLGKSGADAVLKAFSRICIVLNKYQDKLLVAIGLAEAAGLITNSEAVEAAAFVATARTLCTIFGKIAANSGF